MKIVCLLFFLFNQTRVVFFFVYTQFYFCICRGKFEVFFFIASSFYFEMWKYLSWFCRQFCFRILGGFEADLIFDFENEASSDQQNGKTKFIDVTIVDNKQIASKFWKPNVLNINQIFRTSINQNRHIAIIHIPWDRETIFRRRIQSKNRKKNTAPTTLVFGNILSMVGRCSHCCNIMSNRVDVSDLEVGARIRYGDNDLATIKYIGEVSTNYYVFRFFTFFFWISIVDNQIICIKNYPDTETFRWRKPKIALTSWYKSWNKQFLGHLWIDKAIAWIRWKIRCRNYNRAESFSYMTESSAEKLVKIRNKFSKVQEKSWKKIQETRIFSSKFIKNGNQWCIIRKNKSIPRISIDFN